MKAEPFQGPGWRPESRWNQEQLQHRNWQKPERSRDWVLLQLGSSGQLQQRNRTLLQGIGTSAVKEHVTAVVQAQQVTAVQEQGSAAAQQ